MRFRSKIISVIFIILIIIIPLIYYILNPIYDFDLDIGEKRMKSDFILDDNIDNLGKNIETYYNDRIPYRNYLIKANRDIESFINNIFKSSFSEKNINNLEIDPYVDNYPMITSDNNMVILGQSDWLFLNNKDLLDIYTKKNIKDDSYFENLKEEIDELYKIANEEGKEIYILIAPEKQEIYEEYMPTLEISDDEYNFSEKIVKYIKDNIDIDIIYPRELIKNMKDKYRMYKKYDTHWNQISSYISLSEIYKNMGINTPRLDTLNIEEIEEIGDEANTRTPECRDLALLANMNYEDYPYSFEYNVDYQGLSKKDKEKIKNKKLCFIGESFGVNIYINLKKDFPDNIFIRGVEDLPEDRGLNFILDSDIIIYEVAERYLNTLFFDNIKKIKKSLEFGENHNF